MVGVAQLALLLPATTFMLLGGSLADRYGGKQVAVVSQSLALLPLVILAMALFTEQLTFSLMIGYALLIGTLQAFVTPARDSLLNTVARGQIQRTVIKVTLVQFLVQMGGFVLAGSADRVGGFLIVFTQTLIVASGIFALSRLPQVESIRTSSRSRRPLLRTVLQSIRSGFRSVWRDGSMRIVVIQNVAMGACFMGSYVVTIPLLIRDRYDGSSEDLALVNLVNSAGLVTTILLQLFFRDIKHKGNALLIAHGLGAAILALGGLNLEFGYFLIMMFFWGACGGVAMSMSRTIMQELAPERQRGSVMSFFSFSFMGAGPLGAVLWGFTADYIGPSITLVIACSIMFTVILVLSFVRKRLIQ